LPALTPDYDDDPDRWNSWRPRRDVHDVVAPELRGPVLDIGCGDGRLAQVLAPSVIWVGVDVSLTQLASNPFKPLVQADMRSLPFRDGAFADVTHLWCLYHVDDPGAAIAEAHRVLRTGGRYFACTNARSSDPELMWEGYPPSPFDAEEAAEIVSEYFSDVVEERWDAKLYPLERREEVEAFCRHHFIPPDRAAGVELPLWLTKRGVLVRASKR
jgi:SAM-dependent methyltransferase